MKTASGKIVRALCCLMLLGSIMEAGSENDGNRNVYYGEEAGASLGSASADNLFLGYGSGVKDDLGIRNVFVGNYSGYQNTVGAYNTFLGTLSGMRNIGGAFNTFIGYQSGYSNISGRGNLFVGDFSGQRNGKGEGNTFIGSHSGIANETGQRNTFLGAWSGQDAAPEMEGSLFLGYMAGYGATRSNTLYIANNETSPLIYGEFDTPLVQINGKLKVKGGVETSGPISLVFRKKRSKNLLKMMDLQVKNLDPDFQSDVALALSNQGAGFSWWLQTLETKQGVALTKRGNGAFEFRLFDTDPEDPATVVLRLANGAWCDGVWHDASSRALKTDIQPLDGDRAMEAFERLRPVTYAYKAHPSDRKVGFIAEEVPDLVADPQRRSLSAMDMVALLTRVVQVQRETMAEKDREILEMKRRIDALEALGDRVRSLEAELSKLQPIGE
jgi:hypothetical protein